MTPEAREVRAKALAALLQRALDPSVSRSLRKQALVQLDHQVLMAWEEMDQQGQLVRKRAIPVKDSRDRYS